MQLSSAATCFITPELFVDETLYILYIVKVPM